VSHDEATGTGKSFVAGSTLALIVCNGPVVAFTFGLSRWFYAACVHGACSGGKVHDWCSGVTRCECRGKAVLGFQRCALIFSKGATRHIVQKPSRRTG
jgi:hypothetical protein